MPPMPPVPPQVQQLIDLLVAAPPLEGYVVVVFMCVELMINGVNLTLVAFADYLPNAGGLGASYAVLVIAIAAAEIAVGLAIVLAVFRTRRTVNVDEVTSMRG